RDHTRLPRRPAGRLQAAPARAGASRAVAAHSDGKDRQEGIAHRAREGGPMTTQVQDILDKARETVSVRDVYGEPYERDGVTIIPVARVMGAGGGGSGTGGEGEGSGHGYALKSEPVGVYVIQGGRVDWQPAVNVDKIISGAFVVGVVGIIGVPRIIKQ